MLAKQLENKLKSQAAVDFFVSYGVTLIIILVIVSIIYNIGSFNPALATPFCNPSPGFTCGFYALNTSGVLTLKVAQAIGAPIIINGVACSIRLNSTGDKPQYGNIYVTNALIYYPPSYNPGGNVMYSDSYYIFHLYCYGSKGIETTKKLGASFNGYVWLNYTIANSGSYTQKMVTFTAVYT